MCVLGFTQMNRGENLPQKMTKRSNTYETGLNEKKDTDILTFLEP